MLSAQSDMDAQETPSSAAAAARRHFFALRNGLIADTLRKGGMEQKYIFGLQLPQIKEIAAQTRETCEDTAALARELWNDRECRESRLLAIHLMTPEEITTEEAAAWAKDIRTREEGDILAFRLIRYLPGAPAIAAELGASEDRLRAYAAEAIGRFVTL